MKIVKDILQEKGTEVHTVEQHESVYTALKKLAEKNIGALVVTDEHGTVVGLMSERDYARKIILKGMSSLDTPVNAIMEKTMYFIQPENTVEECMALVTEIRHRHLPVLKDGELLGLVSIGDLVKATIEEKEFLINQLTNYIKSG
ncbi:CBS domain-containing protein [Pelobacter seleniigenes]|uniref:CBS domain-containing protein n=1 Tax=Pelobacter seleniigenes TaxID=407188 RepID=UPI0004A75282|nr:CBS domain-containing protein [Pelobacter seleniigenes]